MKKFIWILVALGILGALAGGGSSDSGSTTQSTGTTSQQAQTVQQSSTASANTTTLADVKRWYENQTNGVADSLVSMANSINAVSGTKVTNKKLIFGDPWGEVYYSFQFTCNVNGQKHSGEARGFLPYGGDTIEWFHFEIFSNTSSTSLVEHYDDAYDDIVEDYYKELAATYR